MGTQGVVSVVKDGEVIAKAVAGMNGFNAHHLAAEIRGRSSITPEELLDAAKKVGFGCESTLVVQGPTKNLYEGDADLRGLYLDPAKFRNPRFNPRSEDGTAAHVVVVKLRS